MTIVNNLPLTGEKDLTNATREFLYQIGYLSKGSDPDIPEKMFIECFLSRSDKAWLVDELAAVLNTSRPTVYRHLNKLKGLDLLEEVEQENEETGQVKKAYKLRYSNISKAWKFVEANVELAMENYRKTIDHLQELIEQNKNK
ncbi:MAG: helix-turn-helix transcriptional regulator [Thermoplasmata archaeon]|nr:MAG: helix-turn-helix transcriptional regulator [Thermoplasmata archaeon]